MIQKRNKTPSDQPAQPKTKNAGVKPPSRGKNKRGKQKGKAERKREWVYIYVCVSKK